MCRPSICMQCLCMLADRDGCLLSAVAYISYVQLYYLCGYIGYMQKWHGNGVQLATIFIVYRKIDFIS